MTVNPPPTTTLYGSDVGSGLATYAQLYLQTGVPTARNVVIRSLDTTKVYLRLVPGHLREDYDKAMPPIAVTSV